MTEEEHLKIDQSHRVWLKLDSKVFTAILSVLSFLIGVVTTAEHFRTNVTDRLTIMEEKLKEVNGELVIVKRQHDTLLQNHLDDLNAQREIMREIQEHDRREPSLIMRYYKPPQRQSKPERAPAPKYEP